MPKKIIAKAQKMLPASAAPKLKTFMTDLYTSVPPEDLALIEPKMLASVAKIHWEMSRKRIKDEPVVKIRNLPSHRGKLGHTVVDVVNNDMAFLVDSVAALITQKYSNVRVLLHPVLYVKKDKAGKAVEVSSQFDENRVAQSHMHIEFQRQLTDEQLESLERDLYQVLQDVHWATRDWLLMREQLRECQRGLNLAPEKKYNDEEIEEYLYFLEYLYKDNFTLLGYREYKFEEKKGNVESRLVKGKSLGLLHDEVRPVYISEDKRGLPNVLQRLRRELPPLSVSKVNKDSTVHRSVPLDAVAVKQFDKKGNVVGECLFIGLLTSVTYSRSIQDVPLLRHKTELTMRLSGFEAGSHDYKALRHILEKYPRDELFQMDVEELLKTSLSILRLQERQRIALYSRVDPFKRYVSSLVYVPRELYDTRLRLKMQKILSTEMGGEVSSFHTNLDDSPFARVLYRIKLQQREMEDFDNDAIEALLQEAGRTWEERLSSALYKEVDSEQEVVRLTERYGNAFPINYTDHSTPKQSFYDIYKVEDVLETGALSFDLYRTKDCAKDELQLKVYKPESPIPLADVLPILKNLGLHAISEVPYKVKPGNCDHALWIHDFSLKRHDTRNGIDLEKVKSQFEMALFKIWSGEMEDDSLNALVLNAGAAWREVIILRAYVRYMRQMRYHFDTTFIEGTLVRNAHISADLIGLFKARFNPKSRKAADKLAASHMKAVLKALENVKSLDEDKVIRAILNLMSSSVRTNYFQKDEQGQPKPCLSIKLNSREITGLPEPRPYREIFVYAPRVEGVHLRGDRIARGGIRWSDRHEDFRTEVLGLMKAQQVKNAVIVPMGSKGGFIVKKPPTEGGRDAFFAEGIACYKTFITGLLDVTDNRKGTKIVPPKNVVRHEDFDPYLVVAADKGTATFSDIANGISQDFGFWLDDAFASGGSAGYDHKKMGITARGAWESVKRHFRELNHDTQSKKFDVVGIGDMGGDVFGNGMLLSEHIALIGAFNHLHIFCDPDPDVKSSFKERQRLFDNVKGWGDYNHKTLSKGGMIYERSAKSLKLTPEIKARFDIDKDQVAPYELIKAMLKARTDLLWFGGIGTYIKATTETDADVKDKGNDALRINATELRTRVVAEGANLAVTQAARIEFSQKGGRINTDFIDNSAGVDSSDHEVNIKILLTDVLNDPAYNMNRKKRDKLLESMTENVASLVLRHNYQQTQGISLIGVKAAENLEEHANLIHFLEETAELNRRLEYLPSDEVLEERMNVGHGLTSPEVSVLVSYTKISLFKDLLDTDIPDTEAVYDDWLVNYFPVALRKKYKKEILAHRLKREIIATGISNDVINRMGPTFIMNMMNKTGEDVATIVRAYLAVCEIFGLQDLWAQIEALDNKVLAVVQLQAMRRVAKIVEREILWFLKRFDGELTIEKASADFKEGVVTLSKHIQSIMTEERSHTISQRKTSGISDGFPPALAGKLSLMPAMGAAGDIIRISKACGMDIPVVAKTYFAIGERFHIDWFVRKIRYMDVEGHWQEKAVEGLMEQFHDIQANLTMNILGDVGKKSSKKKAQNDNDLGLIEKWCERHAGGGHQFDELAEELRQAGNIDIAMLMIAEQRLRGLCQYVA